MTTPTETTPEPGQEPRWIYLVGYILLSVSFAIFIAVDQWYTGDENFSIFFIHYAAAIVYAFILLINKSIGVLKSWKKENIHKTILLLNLFLISAYALNRELPVFEDSVTWLCVYLVVTSLTALSYRLHVASYWVRMVRLFVLGSACIFYFYLAVYAANFYLVGFIGTLFFGIGAHIFIPIFWLIGLITLIRNSCTDKLSYGWVAMGSVATIVVCVSFILIWNTRVSSIERMSNQSVLNAQTELPDWVRIGQTIENDWITHRILKSNLVYSVSNNDFQFDLFPSGARWDEQKKHDPLVFLASMGSTCNLSNETRVKILRTITDNRHRAQERLWSGDNLTTAYVVTDVDIYPAWRLAYTEKYFNIRNNKAPRGWWGATQEAIYTFQLPEGTVVTSLSLWINGKEEKSILTSKQKANEAYNTIVGVERRDPSVVHWQEGNTITARVFPCTRDEERKFKIGFSSPLPIHNGYVVYNNITFQGPNPEDAKETTRIRFMSNPEGLQMPSGFVQNAKGEYVREGAYDPDLSIVFNETPLSSGSFSFDGFVYSMVPATPEWQPVSFSDIYLDLNNSWQSSELDALKFLCQERNVMVYVEDEWVKLTLANWAEVTEQGISQNFSLFPFHLIRDVNTALVISQGKDLAPHLSDFKESIFADRVSKFFSDQHRVKLFNLNNGASTYVRTFRELRGLEFAEGNVQNLKDMLQQNRFPVTAESDARIVLHDAGVAILKQKADAAQATQTAPDHLARLFAYNNIMRMVGATYFHDQFVNDTLVQEATKAYVVSPVSSLIVLETKEDYERFGIQDSANSLHNASKQSSGAVPEPHEWLMIIVFVLLILFTVVKRYRLKPQM